MALPSAIRVNASVPFPALIQGTGGITISKVNGIWNVGLSTLPIPVTTTSLTINPTPVSLNPGLTINQTVPLTGTAVGPITLNSITVGSDGYNITGPNNELIALAVTNFFGGNAVGQRAAILATVSQNSATNNPSASVAITGVGTMSAPAGGTGTTLGLSKGGVAGANPIAQLLNGATNVNYLVANECDVGIQTGASGALRIGCGAVGSLQLQGAVYDCGFAIWGAPTQPGFKFGLQLINYGGGLPVATTGTILGTDGTTWTVANGIDLSSGLTITGNAFASPGFSVSGSGALSGSTLSATAFVLSPIVYGGAAVGSSLSLISTAAAGTTDAIIFKVGNNGATEAARFLHSGGLGIGTTSDPGFGLLYTNSASFLIRTKTSYTNGAAAAAGTLGNAPTAGNPTKWIPVDDNGTTRFIPAW